MCALGIAGRNAVPPARVPVIEQALFDAVCDRIRRGADGALKAMLGHVIDNDLTSEQFNALLAIPGLQYLTESTGDSA